MESLMQFLDESSSHKWLIDIKPSLDSSCTEEGSSIEMDPGCVAKCWTIDVNGFHFDSSRDKFSVRDHRHLKATAALTKKAPISESLNPSISASLNGLTLSNSGDDTTIISVLASRNSNQKSSSHCSLKKILWRYLCPLIPWSKGAKDSRLVSPNSSKRCTNSAESSRRMSSSRSSIEWCHSNADISISDAILHCKRSNWQEKY